jgi:hypothetical protein
MGLRAIYNNIELKLETVSEIKHIHTWNNQFADILADNNATDVTIPFPAVFMEVIVNEIETESGGNQLWNCNLNLHVAHVFYHDGHEFEQNWEVFDLVDTLHTYFHGWQPTGCSALVEIGLVQDHSHGNLYHFIMGYKFNYINNWNQHTILSPTPLTLQISGVTFPTISGVTY